uniref:Uncharacterized protein n=1 Tax=Nelumbo nucifera TaxID=4432 RepID=A0A822Y0E8_NELNU|nr:TPA_asm: hypothetical protein HUJ06_024581 [Nelumbo nucifera]
MYKQNTNNECSDPRRCLDTVETNKVVFQTKSGSEFLPEVCQCNRGGFFGFCQFVLDDDDD